jgi:hypothetical protein
MSRESNNAPSPKMVNFSVDKSKDPFNNTNSQSGEVSLSPSSKENNNREQKQKKEISPPRNFKLKAKQSYEKQIALK